MRVKNIKLLLMAVIGCIVMTGCGSKPADNKIQDLPNDAMILPTDENETQAEEITDAKEPDADEKVNAEKLSEKEDSEKTLEDMFDEFLRGERNCYTDDKFESALSYAFGTYDSDTYEFGCMFDEAASFSYDDIIAGLNEKSEMYFIDMAKVTKSYTIEETSSGGKVAALKLQNLGIYEPNDDSFAILFFVMSDDELKLTYAYDSWCRNYCPLMEGMIMRGTGSGGAGDSYSWCEYIDEAGHKKALYSIETLYDEWIAMDGQFSYGMETTDWHADGSAISKIATSEKSYYYIDSEGNDNTEKLYEYIGHLKDEGYAQTTDLDELIARCYKEAGIKNAASEEIDDWIEIN